MKDLTAIIDNAVTKGYSVGWATDVSEPYFSYKNGVAYVPDMDLDQINAENKQTLFTEPKRIKQSLRTCVKKALTTFLQRMITVCIS